jgi:tryptophanyl-tRNA synthetase
MMRPMIQLQEEHSLFAFLANYHAMTSLSDGNELRKNTIEAAIDFLAVGLDPDKSCFFVQSDIPEVTQLSWILACHTSLGLLERSHSYKDKVAKGITPNSGLYTYPILMAADILLYKSEIVPVGKDQKQHLEITRDIAIRFNGVFGDILTIPEALIQDDIAVIPGLDGQKMSKSYDNSIGLFDGESVLKKKVMRIVTYSTPVVEPNNPETCNLFARYRLFADSEKLENLRDRYVRGGTGYGDVKKELFGMIWEYFAPFRKRRNELASDRGELMNILAKGAEKARAVARQTLKEINDVTGISYRC